MKRFTSKKPLAIRSNGLTLLPTRAIPSKTEIARITKAKYGGIRKGNSGREEEKGEKTGKKVRQYLLSGLSSSEAREVRIRTESDFSQISG